MQSEYGSDRDSLFENNSISSSRTLDTPPASPIVGKKYARIAEHHNVVFELPRPKFYSSFKAVESTESPSLKIKIYHYDNYTVKLRKDRLRKLDDLVSVVKSRVPNYNYLELSFKNKRIKPIPLQNLIIEDMVMDFVLTKDVIYINAM